MWNRLAILSKQRHAVIFTTKRRLTETTSNRPRVAVVGGGIAGTLCSLVLKNRGILPRLLDASCTTTVLPSSSSSSSSSSDHGVAASSSNNSLSRVLRRRATAIPFFRARRDNPPLTSVLKMLEMEGILTSMDAARMGILGSNSQSFLPTSVVSATIQRNQRDEQPPLPPSSSHYGHLMDQGDFCGFVNHQDSMTTYRGDDHLCSKIWERAGIDVLQNTTVLRANTVPGGGWQLQLQTTQNNSETVEDHVYDGLVLATGGHSSWLAAQTVQSIAYEEQRAAAATTNNHHSNHDDGGEEETNGLPQTNITDRLYQLANVLQGIHNDNLHHKIPLYTLTVQFPQSDNENDEDYPFDAVSVHGSPYIQFLLRESSLQHRNTWTAISTCSFVSHILQSQNGTTTHDVEVVLQDTMLTEMKRLLQKSQSASVLASSSSSSSSSIEILSGQLWNHAFSHATMNLKEDSIALQPWRLAICGDYLANQERHMNPFEAASMSGLEAGERMATILVGTQEG